MDMKRLLSTFFLLFAVSVLSASQPADGLSVLWWGSQVRASEMTEVMEEYSRERGMPVSGRGSEWTSYWAMMATKAAGASLPDVLLMDQYYIGDYAGKGLLEPLDGYAEDGTLPEVEGELREASLYDGVLYGYPLGVTAPVMFYDKRVTEAAGIDIPERMTFSEFRDISSIIYQRVGVQALCDGGLNMLVFYARALGLDPFESIAEGDGRAVRMMFRDIEAFSAEDCSVPISNLSGKDLTVPDQMPITDLTSWNGYGFANQVGIFDAFAGYGQIGWTLPPVPDDATAEPMYTKPCVYLSISSASRKKDEAASFIGDVARKSAKGLLSGEMGFPADEGAAGLMPGYAQEMQAFISRGYPMVRQFHAGAGNLEEVLVKYTDMIRTGELSADEAADLFMEEAGGILA